MQKQKFIENFDKSMASLIDMTKYFCTNNLVDNYLFSIQPSGTDVHKDMNDKEIDNLKTLNKYTNKYLTREEVVELLWNVGEVPLWINASVYESRTDVTIIHLLYSRRLRDEDNLYNDAMEFPPFNPLVPLSPDSDFRNEIKKFDINWKKELDDKNQPKSIFDKLRKLFATNKENL